MNTKEHYDNLIDADNDPVRDTAPLREYMDKWDGQRFVECLNLSRSKSVLEIGVGTGRLAIRTSPLCHKLYGIDFSKKTIARAKENLSPYKNVELLCADFLEYKFETTFDVIYSSLTWFHIKEKQKAINKVCSLLNNDGLFVVSIDKNQTPYIDFGDYKLITYPDTPENIVLSAEMAGMKLKEITETDFAFILSFTH